MIHSPFHALSQISTNFLNAGNLVTILEISIAAYVVFLIVHWAVLRKRLKIFHYIILLLLIASFGYVRTNSAYYEWLINKENEEYQQQAAITTAANNARLEAMKKSGLIDMNDENAVRAFLTSKVFKSFDGGQTAKFYANGNFEGSNGPNTFSGSWKLFHTEDGKYQIIHVMDNLGAGEIRVTNRKVIYSVKPYLIFQ